MHLATPRLHLREYTPDDLAALAAYQADPRMREFHGPDDVTEAAVANLLALFLRWAAESPRRHVQLAIALAEQPGVVIGSCGLRAVDGVLGEAEFGLELAPDRWGRGLAMEASRALLDAGFHDLGLRAVRGESVSANTRVAAMVRRLGFEQAGTRPGPAWMTERGWSHVEWWLPRERWAVRGDSTSPPG